MSVLVSRVVGGSYPVSGRVAVVPHQGPAEQQGGTLRPAWRGRPRPLGPGVEAHRAGVPDVVAADVVPDRERLAALEPGDHILDRQAERGPDRAHRPRRVSAEV